jgi:hypothetical protein
MARTKGATSLKKRLESASETERAAIQALIDKKLAPKTGKRGRPKGSTNKTKYHAKGAIGGQYEYIIPPTPVPLIEVLQEVPLEEDKVFLSDKDDTPIRLEYNSFGDTKLNDDHSYYQHTHTDGKLFFFQIVLRGEIILSPNYTTREECHKHLIKVLEG